MAEAPAARILVPLELWPSIALRLPPLAWGGLVSLVLVSGALIFRAILEGGGQTPGQAPVDLDFATRVALVASLTTGYALAIWCWIPAAVSRDYAELGVPGTLGSADDPGALYTVAPERLRKSRLAGLLGVTFFVAIIEVPSALAGARFGGAWTSLHALTYMLGLGVLFFWIAGRCAYFSIQGTREASDDLPIDLLDPRPLEVFGRLALRNALVWVVGLSIASLAFVNPELRIAESLVVFVPILLSTLAIAGAAMFLPMRGIHARIRAAKREELDRVEAAIRGEAGALAGTRIEGRDPAPSLADLIAYKGLVESAREWPFDGSSLRRFGLYLLIPLASWLGGALVERGLSVLLD